MSRFQQIRDRLPTLYRPDRDNSSSLLTLILRAAASALEEADVQATVVLQSHWFNYADAALFHPFFTRTYQLEKKPLPPPTDAILAEFPYIHDLARLAALLPAEPWREPAASRELVEQFRTRLERIVRIYRNGLGTVSAVRSMVEAQLPRVAGSSFDAPFFFEDPADAATHLEQAIPRGEPLDMVGPLMRWTISNPSQGASAPTIYVQGIAPASPAVEATAQPLLELYSTGGRLIRTGIAYRGTVAPDKALRLRPAYSSWLGAAAGLLRSQHQPSSETSADPTAPGPWSLSDGSPAPVSAVEQSADRVLWAAAINGGHGELRRFDGTAWTSALSGFAEILCLRADGELLWIGASDGLHKLPLHPEGALTATPVSSLSGRKVAALQPGPNRSFWVGTDSGASQLASDETLTDLPLSATAVRDIHIDASGTVFFSCELGLFQLRSNSEWYWYSGEAATEQVPDWRRLDTASGQPASLPDAAQVFLPPCSCALRARDGFLWIGTTQGIARYGAHSVGGLVFETSLEAYPDLGTGAIFSIRQDERGIVWAASERGLFRHDGRDWWQHQDGAWVHLGRADTILDGQKLARGSWRFQRNGGRWERFDTRSRSWIPFAGAVRSKEQAAIFGITWTDEVFAESGAWNGSTFSEPTAVPAPDLVLRYKPDDQRIVDGGIAAIPRLPAGSSIWRYLQLEAVPLPDPGVDPFWTTEGRLITAASKQPDTAEGRYNIRRPPPPSDFDEAVFAYPPAARVWFEWNSKGPLSFLVRLKTDSAQIDPAIVDRVWQGIQQVRPAGVRAMLAVEEEIVRGKQDG
jgi:hypothetical protein